jgi:Na+/melibiose symporter-like transporter
MKKLNATAISIIATGILIVLLILSQESRDRGINDVGIALFIIGMMFTVVYWITSEEDPRPLFKKEKKKPMIVFTITFKGTKTGKLIQYTSSDFIRVNRRLEILSNAGVKYDVKIKQVNSDEYRKNRQGNQRTFKRGEVVQ